MARADHVKVGPSGRREAAWPWRDRARHQAVVVGRQRWRMLLLVSDPWVRAGLAIWVCVPDQTHIRSSRGATAPGFRLRRAGSRGRGHSSLRRLRPCNPSVRPPGSAEA